jgi:hypothetical protein
MNDHKSKNDLIDLIDLPEWKRADWLKCFHREVFWLHAVDLWLGNSTLKLPDVGSFSLNRHLLHKNFGMFRQYYYMNFSSCSHYTWKKIIYITKLIEEI